MTSAKRPFTTQQLDVLSKTLRSALVSDILDGLGLWHQCLAPGLVPLDPGATLIGYAFPVSSEAVTQVPDEPYVGLLRALDSICADEVWVVSCDTDAALWGELTSTACRSRGARGAVCEGFVRDIWMVRNIGFPVFSRGASPKDANGRMEIISHSASVRVSDVEVFRDDLIVADDDGVAVVPGALVEKVVSAALDKSSAESLFRAAVAEGELPSAAYQRYGVL